MIGQTFENKHTGDKATVVRTERIETPEGTAIIYVFDNHDRWNEYLFQENWIKVTTTFDEVTTTFI